MKFFLTIIALFNLILVSSFSNIEYITEFNKFITRYNRHYIGDEFIYRFNNFKENYDFIANHSIIKSHSYRLDVNEYADLSWNEFRQIKLGLHKIKSTTSSCTPGTEFAHMSVANLPATVDWRQHNAVTPVKNQQQCGSCWAFSTTGSVEGIHAIKTGKLVSVSEQQLVDCSSSYGNDGCSGGLMDNGFKYIIDNGGLCSEDAYPYTAVGGTCNTTCTRVVSITGCVDVPTNNEDALQAAVAQQPVSIAIEADQQVFQFYSGGVLSDVSCGTNLDHGVLLVGYGVENNQKYWLVKNSWGSSWGDAGYIKILRGTGSGNAGVCGVAMQPSLAT